jgi:serine/threonine protein kinase
MIFSKPLEQVENVLMFIGSFGRVRLAREKSAKKFLAIKILKKAEVIRLKQVDHIVSECCILGMIQHPFIVFKHVIP